MGEHQPGKVTPLFRCFNQSISMHNRLILIRPLTIQVLRLKSLSPSVTSALWPFDKEATLYYLTNHFQPVIILVTVNFKPKVIKAT